MRRTIGIVGLGLLSVCSVALGQSAGLPVQLTVREPAGVARVDEPVTTGVPFAPGVLSKGRGLALTDSAGKAVPLQTRVLASWPDGSVKWVLLDFQASVEAGKSAEFTLADAPAKAPAIPGIKVIEHADSLAIDTGPLQATLSRKAFDLFSAAKVDGKDALAGRPGGLVITDTAGKQRTSTADLADGFKLQVTEAGPLRVVVRADGEVQATEKYRIGFTCWYHFAAGRKEVRVFLTMRNLAGKAITATDQSSVRDMEYLNAIEKLDGNVPVEAVDLVLSVKPADQFVLSGDPDPITGKLDGSVKLYQDSSAGWMWQAGDGKVVDPRLKANAEWMAANAPAAAKGKPFWEYEPSQYASLTNKNQFCGYSFRGYKVYDKDGKETAAGDRSRGFAQLGEMAVAVRWFWQMCPKSIELKADGTISLGLWPKEFANRYVFEGHIHKTHELLFAFGQPTTGEAIHPADAAFRRFDRRLLAVAPKEYYCATGAFNGPLMPENRKDFARFEDWALTAVQDGLNKNVNISFDSSLEIEREKTDFFGVWHFGDTSKRGWRGFGQYLELDIPYCLLAHFARTLNRSFFDEGEIHVRQLMDVPAHGGGYGHQAGESSHYYTSGAFFFYYLTGLDFVRDSLKASHDLFAKPAPWHARSFAITMWSNLDMYRQFGEPQYLDKIKADLDWFVKGQNAVTGFRPYGQVNFQEFMLGMMMDSLGQYCTLFPDDQLARDRLVALSNAVMRTHEKGEAGIRQKFKDSKPWEQDNSCCNGHTWAYVFTGRDKHLDFAAKLLDASLRPGDEKWPVYRTGTGSGKYWSEFGHRNSQTCMWARWHRSVHGTPKPPAAVTDLAASVADGKLTVTWTAPADGLATRFVVKLAAKPLADDVLTEEETAAANWWTTPVAGQLRVEPGPAGNKMSMVVPAPAKGPTFVAVRGMAQAGPITAVSDLSNVVEVK